MVQVNKSAQPGLFTIWIFPYLNIFLKAWPLTIDQIDNKQLKYMCKFPQTIFFPQLYVVQNDEISINEICL